MPPPPAIPDGKYRSVIDLIIGLAVKGIDYGTFRQDLGGAFGGIEDVLVQSEAAAESEILVQSERRGLSLEEQLAVAVRFVMVSSSDAAAAAHWLSNATAADMSRALNGTYNGTHFTPKYSVTSISPAAVRAVYFSAPPPAQPPPSAPMPPLPPGSEWASDHPYLTCADPDGDVTAVSCVYTYCLHSDGSTTSSIGHNDCEEDVHEIVHEILPGWRVRLSREWEIQASAAKAKTVTIRSSGNGAVIEGAGNHRLFAVGADSPIDGAPPPKKSVLKLESITLTNGVAEKGGAIWIKTNQEDGTEKNAANLTDVTISNCRAVSNFGRVNGGERRCTLPNPQLRSILCLIYA